MEWRIFLLQSILLSHQIFFSNEESINVENDNGLIVKISNGKIRGFSHQLLEKGNSATKRNAHIFLGIPFAQAPVGALRFEKPIDPKRWADVKNATEFGPGCHPSFKLPVEFVPDMRYDEDCLQLNVMAPGWKSPSQNGLFPVIIWIHGGAFEIGNAKIYGYKFITEEFVSKGIVFVTVQYRLGPFGFASTGDAKFAGNYGLWDQLAALKYIKTNIKNFGGDPGKITLLGHSAGSASVAFHTISKHSKDLFSQAIQMSGSMLAGWAVSNSVIGETEKLAASLKCEKRKLKECLRSKTVHELQEAVEKNPAKRGVDMVRWKPRPDADFFVDNLSNLIKQAPKKPTISGFTNVEALIFALVEEMHTANTIVKAKFKNFGLTEFVDFVENSFVVSDNVTGRNRTKDIHRELIDFYLNSEKNVKKDYKFYLAKYVELISDALFVIPILIESRMKMAAQWPTYLYLIDHYNKNSQFSRDLPVKGAYHSLEYAYLFNLTLSENPATFTDEDLAFGDILRSSIVNFAKTGDPSTKFLKWSPNNFARLNIRPEMMKNDEGVMKKFNFWQRIRDTYDF